MALAFIVIQDKIRAAMELWSHLKGFTYSPKSDTVFDVEYLHEALALFRELVRGGRHFRADRPIYLVAVTHHTGIEIDDTLRDGYEAITKFSNQPLIGYWKDPDGRSYLDAVVVAQFINEEGAIREGKKHGQEFILKIRPDGTYDHIQTD
ncbi:MAG: hypothetical protein EB830_00420 [Nitrosopumilus sp. H13]|nr:MAG: hypothetical protein EB830_00420 [Nitrosopumilus sp. H13]